MSGDALTKNWLRLLSNKLPFLSSRESEGKIFIAVIKSSVHNGKRFLWRAASRNATMWGIIADGPKHFSNNSRHRSQLFRLYRRYHTSRYFISGFCPYKALVWGTRFLHVPFCASNRQNIILELITEVSYAVDMQLLERERERVYSCCSKFFILGY